MSSTTRLPLFLVPAFTDLGVASPAAIRSFSTSSCAQARHRTSRKGARDSNRERGVSAIRRTGPRHQLSIDNKFQELPRPRKESDRPLDDARFAINEKHGLYGFFNEKRQTVLPPEEEDVHGRSWSYHELCFKSFEDLHSLYWQCIYELNRTRTRQVEHMKLKLGYGMVEIKDRLDTLQTTMRTIRQVLDHRFQAHDEARLLVEKKGWTQIQQDIEDERQRKLDEQAVRDAEDQSQFLTGQDADRLRVEAQQEGGEAPNDYAPRRRIGPRPAR